MHEPDVPDGAVGVWLPGHHAKYSGGECNVAFRGALFQQFVQRLPSPHLRLQGEVRRVGARAFRVGFDAQLRPWVRDAAGQPLRALPRAAKGGDAALATAAAVAWKAMRERMTWLRIMWSGRPTSLANGR